MWISYFIGKGIKTRFESILTSDFFDICISEDLLTELEAVASYKKLKKYIDADLAKSVVTAIRKDRTITCVTTNVQDCRDPKDNYLLSLSVDAKAKYLITGDKPDLLNLKQYKQTKIITFSDFCKKYGI